MKIMKIRKPYISLDSIILYIMVVLFILSSSSMFTVITDFYDYGVSDTAFIKAFCVMAFFYWVLLLLKNTRIGLNSLIFAMLLVIYFAIYLLYTQIGIFSFTSQVILPILIIFLLCSTEGTRVFFGKFMYVFSRLIFIIAIISLIFYFGGTLLGLFPKRAVSYYNNGYMYNGYCYSIFYFENPLQNQDIFNIKIYRNVGLFMEAPGYASMLIYALFWELTGINKKRKTVIIVLVLTLITTFSTKGILITGAMLSLYIIFNTENHSFKIYMKAFSPILLLLAIWITYVVLSIKISGSGYNSVMIRLDDIFAAFKTFLKSPIFGAGYFNLTAIYENFRYTSLQGNPTCGLINIFAYGGLYLGLFFIIGLLLYIFSPILKRNDKIIFIVMIIAILCTSAIQYSIMFYLFVISGYAEKLNFKYEQRKVY